jgi:hypothetical protein
VYLLLVVVFVEVTLWCDPLLLLPLPLFSIVDCVLLVMQLRLLCCVVFCDVCIYCYCCC